jgi:hypothetical protein
VSIFASPRPTLWTCRRLATIPERELRFAMHIFKLLDRGDFWLA